jgi:hypothetical protein
MLAVDEPIFPAGQTDGIPIGGQKRCQEPFSYPRLQRFRSPLRALGRVQAQPTMASTQLVSPNGWLRTTLCRTDVNSGSVSAALTHSTHWAGRATGSSSTSRPVLPCPDSRSHRLPHRQRSARSTKRARRAFRSTYRHTVKRWASVWTRNDLKRP